MKRRNSSISLHDSSGRQNNNSSHYLVDRISNLPDSILGNILSFLPTKNAVATSLLSKRWKFLWRTIHNLDFCLEFEERDEGENMKSKEDYLEEKVEGEDMNFVQFVNHVLLLHDSELLNKFRLVWSHNFILSHAYSWISTAVRKNVHELFVSVGANEPVEMPPSVFKCDSLQSLELHGHNISVSISDEIVFYLPRLKSLKFVSVYFCSGEAFEQLINGCPVLNYLHLCIDFIDGTDFTYIISSTSLKHLELYFQYETRLKLEASSLEYFKIEGYITNIFVHKSLNSLIEAEFRIDLHNHYFSNVDACNSLVEAVRAFDCAKALTLSADVMLALNFATMSLLTEFKRLTRLNIEAYCCYHGWLQELIQSSNNLEVLTVEKDSNWLPASDHYLSHWTDHAEVPRCVSNSLKKVVLNGYYGYDDERKMICYILMHGSALEVMMISLDSERDDEKFELLQEICEFSRKSSACKVKFFG